MPFDFAVENCPLAPLTLYKVGGPAKLGIIPRNEEEVRRAYAWLRDQPGPKLVLGGGSNVLIADEGFPGIVVFSTELTRMDSLGDDRYAVEGGVDLDLFVREVVLRHNYRGAGGLTGIPGSVGGAIYMNAGTVNGSICELLETVDIATETGMRTVPMNASLYGYRGQTFCPPGALIVRGRFKMQPSEEDQTAIYKHYKQRRIEKQPQGNSCGSVFKNPNGDHAGRLIEAAGLKGTRRGGAVISTMHANFILNDNGATCDDILHLVDLAKRTVKEKFGVTLEEEVRIYGQERPDQLIASSDDDDE